MAITLKPETAQAMRESIKRYVAEHLDQDIGPTIYNKAIFDAQKYFETRVVDLEGSCHEPEFQYWRPRK